MVRIKQQIKLRPTVHLIPKHGVSNDQSHQFNGNCDSVDPLRRPLRSYSRLDVLSDSGNKTIESTNHPSVEQTKKDSTETQGSTCFICAAKFASIEDLLIHVKDDHTNDESSEYNELFKSTDNASDDDNSLQVDELDDPDDDESEDIDGDEMKSEENTPRIEHISGSISRPVIFIGGQTAEKRYECKMCDSKFTRRYSMKVHMETLHSEARPFTCDTCGKGFRQRHALISHNRVHTQERPYACVVCERRFNQLSAVKIHMRTHTGVKPYACPVCSRAFADHSTCKKHVRTHTREKPYECKECGRCFAQPGALVIHTRLHTNERPYECDACGRKFNQSAHLKVHERLHTGEKPFKCIHCGKGFTRHDRLKSHYSSMHKDSMNPGSPAVDAGTPGNR